MRAMVEGVEPRFLTLDEILTLHEVAIEAYGGAHGLRDKAALDTCVSQPKQSSGEDYLYEFPLGMAAVYMRQLLQGHPFVDGNKRAALAVCSTFLRLNGWTLDEDDENIAATIRLFLEDGSDVNEIKRWITKHSSKRPSIELRDFFSALQMSDLGTFSESYLAAPTQTEQLQTRTEASHAIPLIKSLREAAQNFHALAEKEPAEPSVSVIGCSASATLLMVIYRHAENEGYEW